MFSAGYYCRTICYALLLQLGYANLALALVLLFNNRILGILVAIVSLMQLNMLKNLGFLWNILSTISYASRDRDTLWMWAVDSQPTLSQLLISGDHHGTWLSGGSDSNSPPGSCLKGGAP